MGDEMAKQGETFSRTEVSHATSGNGTQVGPRLWPDTIDRSRHGGPFQQRHQDNGLFLHVLQDVYQAEKQILKALPDMIEKTTDRWRSQPSAL